ncbi:quercetin dioxygenase-like cupin family protein [Lachnospiraceae bacterium PM6-15]|uniref:Cupin domain-containing protein n=1 Tax=Ohessyouella blattaphilus TaxID=2949333 RepID=A0ABT1EH01_9FIRM|nr:cupin domain-containing protein [Ohessyouella blattaphilus]MCP1109985.1 cupin domain-containing protein [Ohessyouella blattaphilus]MCR8563379.1 cupin domain-containing protein [Ohessyouella blattaphilus]MDL2250906.1 cupin domain-containing protein [Lachnospiraceae bacterium OttesenSCG-928-J05]
MLETIYEFKKTEKKLIEKIVDDDVAMINHIILNQDEGLPEHRSNSNIYILVVRGKLSIKLEEEQKRLYEEGHILNIPYDIKMHITNEQPEQVDFFVIKAPGPRVYKDLI